MAPRTRILAALLLGTVALSAPSTAQRKAVSLAWGKHTAVIEYDVVKVGEHRIDDLPKGKDWRMGGSTASTIRTDLPLVARAGAICVAPGSYRVSIYHTRQDGFGLLVNGPTKVNGRKADPYFQGAKTEGKMTKTLELDWVFVPHDPEEKVGRRGAKPEGVRMPARLELRFGEPRLEMRLEAIAVETHKLKRGFTLDMYRWPETYWKNREKSGSVVAGCIKPKKPRAQDPKAWNMFLTEDEAQLVPWMQAPTDYYGFGEIRKPNEERIIDGEITWQDEATQEIDDEEPMEKEERLALTVSEVEQTKEGFTVHFRIGARSGHAKFPWPRMK